MYECAGVREYLVAVTGKEKFLWKRWMPSGFEALAPDADGILRSPCFPGLWLDPAALWRGDDALLTAVLEQGLATPEHAAFVAQLASRRNA